MQSLKANLKEFRQLLLDFVEFQIECDVECLYYTLLRKYPTSVINGKDLSNYLSRQFKEGGKRVNVFPVTPVAGSNLVLIKEVCCVAAGWAGYVRRWS